ERIAAGKFEEGEVKERQGVPGAEELYVEAIAICEEILPKGKNPEYCKYARVRLAAEYLALAELRLRMTKTREAEASLQKAISHGQEAVKLDPDSPIAKDNLEVARHLLRDLLQQRANAMKQMQRGRKR